MQKYLHKEKCSIYHHLTSEPKQENHEVSECRKPSIGTSLFSSVKWFSKTNIWREKKLLGLEKY